MRLISFILLVFLSFCIAYLLGMAGQGMAGNLLVFAGMILGANYFALKNYQI